MAQTPEGVKKATKTLTDKYGDDYFARIGSMGGKNGHTGGFGYDGRTPIEKLLKRPKKGVLLARVAGARGGKISKRLPRQKQPF